MSALIRAYDIAAGGAATAIGPEDLPSPPAEGHWRWLHLNRTEPDVEALLKATGLPAAVSEAMLVEDTRPRAWTQNGRLLLVLRGVNLNAEIGDDPLISVRLCIADRTVITCRKFQFRAISDLVARCEAGDAPVGVAAFVADLIDGLSRRFATRITDLEGQLEAIEADRGTDREHRLAVLRRELVPLGRFMAPQREALTRLQTLPAGWSSAEDGAILADAENEFQRLIEHLQEVEQRADLLRDELMAEAAQAQASNTYVITILAALFVPLSFITGLLGMNVAGIPGTETPYAFALVVALMAAGFAGGLAVLKWRGWL